MINGSKTTGRLTEYVQLSMWERQVLKMWIAEAVQHTLIWQCTSLGLVDEFQNSCNGFAITHGQLQQAMLEAGYMPRTKANDAWIFDLPADEMQDEWLVES
jgi:hypothetical protein